MCKAKIQLPIIQIRMVRKYLVEYRLWDHSPRNWVRWLIGFFFACGTTRHSVQHIVLYSQHRLHAAIASGFSLSFSLEISPIYFQRENTVMSI